MGAQVMAELTYRKEVNKLLKKYWAEIDQLSEKYTRTSDPVTFHQMENLKKNCIEIMENQIEKEKDPYPVLSEYEDEKWEEHRLHLEMMNNINK